MYFTPEQQSNLNAGRSVFDNGTPPATPPVNQTPAPIPTTPTPEPIKPTIPASSLTGTNNASKIIQDNQKRNDLITKINDTYKTVGGDTLANEAFIQAAAQAKYGRPASADELAKIGANQYGLVGSKVSDVLNRFGLTDKVQNFGITKKEEIAPTTTPTTAKTEPKSVSETLDEMLKNMTFDRTSANKEAGVPELQSAASTLKGELDTMKNEMGLNEVLQTTNVAKTKEGYYAEKATTENQAIPMEEINKQLTKLTESTNISLDKESISQAVADATNTYKYNSKLIEYNIVSSNLQAAQNLVQQTAQDFKNFNTQKLNILQFQNELDQQSKDLLQKEIDREYEMAVKGYAYISSPSALNELAKNKGLDWVKSNTINIGGKIYIKPNEDSTIVSSMAAKYVDAGISSADTIATATAKLKNSKIYQSETNTSKTTYQKLGVDADGNDIYGFVDTTTKEVTPVTTTPGNATSSLGDLIVTGANGSNKWKYGLDVVLQDSNVKYPFPDTGEVIFAGKNGDFGNQIKIRTSAGDEIWLSHLNNINVKVGDKVTKDSLLGIQGNTGDVYSTSGGDGTHLDVTMKNKQGNYYSAQEVSSILGVEKKGSSNTNAQQMAQTIFAGTGSLSGVSTKDNLRGKVSIELEKLKQEAIKNGDVSGMMRASAGGQNMSDTSVTSLEKAVNVIGQLEELQNTINNGKTLPDGTKIPEATGPIWGTIRSNNPYDAKAQAIKAQLTAIVPNLARGIYGEVGVLTDNDVALYAKTLPNLKSTKEVSDLVLAASVRSVQRSIENKMLIQAGSGRDVSGLVKEYEKVKAKADGLEAKISGLSTINNNDQYPIGSIITVGDKNYKSLGGDQFEEIK